jgi:hypothetical protein
LTGWLDVLVNGFLDVKSSECKLDSVEGQRAINSTWGTERFANHGVANNHLSWRFY